MTDRARGTEGAAHDAGVSRLIATGATAALLAVAAGAFGRHALERRLDQHALEIFDTAARYQMYHALAILLVAALAPRLGGRAPIVGRWFLAGILIFSGSLYALALSGLRMLGAITPIGGLCFWAGWISLAIYARRAGR
ncbi:MAG: DUF423 domain-containing protein [Candidatus Eisenbacteria bacterium]|nr:DUF423 domain-containing protein [Candidatus Eisenbacteria bacterium]